MIQRGLFDGPRSESAKQLGMDRAAKSKPRLLDLARSIAVELAQGKDITADDVVAEMVNRGHDVHCLGNSAGSLFRGKHWVQVGWRKSARVHSHSNILRSWRLRG